MSNPFSSKKFVYAITSVILFLVGAYLPAVTAEFGLTLSAETLEVINSNLPVILVLGFALLGGHTLMDALSLYTGFQKLNVREALKDIVDEITPEPESAESAKLGGAVR